MNKKEIVAIKFLLRSGYVLVKFNNVSEVMMLRIAKLRDVILRDKLTVGENITYIF